MADSQSAPQQVPGGVQRFALALSRATGHVDRVQLAIATLLMVALFVVVIAGVVFRYVLHNSLTWSDELARILGIWVLFLGIACAHRRSEHVSVASVLRFLPGISADTARRLGEVVTLVLCVLVAVLGAMAAARNFELGQITPALQMPIGFAYIAIPVGFATMAVQSVVRILVTPPEPDPLEAVG